MNNAIVHIVFDYTTRKLRAKPVNGEGWVRFPKHLRELGAMYSVKELVPGKSGSWLTRGNISKLDNVHHLY
jgi:hypothetical protein